MEKSTFKLSLQKALCFFLCIHLILPPTSIGAITARGDEVKEKALELYHRTRFPHRPLNGKSTPSLEEIQDLEESLFAVKSQLEKDIAEANLKIPSKPTSQENQSDWVEIPSRITSYFDSIQRLLIIRAYRGESVEKTWWSQFDLQIPNSLEDQTILAMIGRNEEMGQHQLSIQKKGEKFFLNLSDYFENYIQGTLLGFVGGRPTEETFLTTLQYMLIYQLYQNLWKLNQIKPKDRPIQAPKLPRHFEEKFSSEDRSLLSRFEDVMEEAKRDSEENQLRLAILQTYHEFGSNMPALLGKDDIDTISQYLKEGLIYERISENAPEENIQNPVGYINDHDIRKRLFLIEDLDFMPTLEPSLDQKISKLWQEWEKATDKKEKGRKRKELAELDLATFAGGVVFEFLSPYSGLLYHLNDEELSKTLKELVFQTSKALLEKVLSDLPPQNERNVGLSESIRPEISDWSEFILYVYEERLEKVDFSSWVQAIRARKKELDENGVRLNLVETLLEESRKIKMVKDAKELTIAVHPNLFFDTYILPKFMKMPSNSRLELWVSKIRQEKSYQAQQRTFHRIIIDAVGDQIASEEVVDEKRLNRFLKSGSKISLGEESSFVTETLGQSDWDQYKTGFSENIKNSLKSLSQLGKKWGFYERYTEKNPALGEILSHTGEKASLYVDGFEKQAFSENVILSRKVTIQKEKRIYSFFGRDATADSTHHQDQQVTLAEALGEISSQSREAAIQTAIPLVNQALEKIEQDTHRAIELTGNARSVRELKAIILDSLFLDALLQAHPVFQREKDALLSDILKPKASDFLMHEYVSKPLIYGSLALIFIDLIPMIADWLPKRLHMKPSSRLRVLTRRLGKVRQLIDLGTNGFLKAVNIALLAIWVPEIIHMTSRYFRVQRREEQLVSSLFGSNILESNIFKYETVLEYQGVEKMARHQLFLELAFLAAPIVPGVGPIAYQGLKKRIQAYKFLNEVIISRGGEKIRGLDIQLDIDAANILEISLNDMWDLAKLKDARSRQLQQIDQVTAELQEYPLNNQSLRRTETDLRKSLDWAYHHLRRKIETSQDLQWTPGEVTPLLEKTLNDSAVRSEILKQLGRDAND